MSRDIAASKRYAKALFEVARERNLISEITEDLTAVVEAVKLSSELRDLLAHPSIQLQAKKQIISSLYEGKINEAVYHLLLVLIENRREELLPYLLVDFIKIADEALGQAEAVVTTPFPLTAEEIAEIAEEFGKLSGKRIRVVTRIDQDLLGGLQVRIGDRLYDGSLSGKLNRLRKSLIGSQAL